MPALLRVAALFIGFVGAAGFLFGQLFSGHFSLGATLAGVGGILAAASALRMASQIRWASRVIYVVAVVALAGVAMDVVHYYRDLAIPGNYYAWPIIGPFAACIAALALLVQRRRASGTDA